MSRGSITLAATPGSSMRGDREVTLRSGFVTGNFFSMLGARPVLGRLMRPEDDVPGAAPVMVISYGLWQRQFDGDPHVVGRMLTMYDRQIHFMIVGVAPPGLDVPAGVDFWAGVVAFYSHRGGPSYALLDPMARLSPGATPAAASAEFASFGQRDGFARSGVPAPYLRAEADRLPEVVLGRVRPVLLVLAIAVALLLLIACTNVGNLLLLRATSRAQELAVRRALGASYGDIALQLFAESSVLAALGGMAGFGVAYGGLRLLLTLAPSELPRLDTVKLAGAPLAITAGVTCLATLLFECCRRSGRREQAWRRRYAAVPARVMTREGLASPSRRWWRGRSHLPSWCLLVRGWSQRA